MTHGPKAKEACRVSQETESAPRRERVRRHDPEQTEPIRDWRGWFHHGPWDCHPRGERRQSSGERASERPTETIERGVEMAYGVVEDYIDQGRKVAQRLNQRQYGPREISEDFQTLTARMLRDSNRFVSLWFDLMASSWDMGWGVVGRGRRRRQPDRSGGATSQDRPARWSPTEPTETVGEPQAVGRTSIALEIESRHPVRVEVDLALGAEELALRATPLQSGSGDGAALRDLRFQPGSEGRAPVLHLVVPPGQPAGDYHGVLLDPHGPTPRGTVSVHLAAERPAAEDVAEQKGTDEGSDP